ncbi:MAG: DNA cytosine methyltransferase, partial [Promethearchaeota archaeon]
TWTRLHPFRLAPIIMGKSTFVHPFGDRTLTIRELARLQTYPDDYIFIGNLAEQKNQIGESVSPVVSRFIAKTILNDYKKY